MRIPFWPKKTRHRVVLIFIILAGILFSLPYVLAHYAFKSALQNAKKTGVLVELSELIPPRVPDIENASVGLEDISTRFESGQLNRNQLEIVQKRVDELLSENITASAEDMEDFRILLEQHQFIFETIDKIRDLDKARFNTNYNTIDPFIMDVPNAMHRLSIARLLKIKAFLQMHEGRIDEAYQTIGDIFRLGNWILKESHFLISLLIGYSTLDEGYEVLHGLGAKSPPNIKHREEGLHLINGIDIQSPFEQAIQMNAYNMDAYFKFFLNSRINHVVGANIGNTFMILALRYPGRFIIWQNQILSLNYITNVYTLRNEPYYKIKDRVVDTSESSSWNFLFMANHFNWEATFRRRDGALAQFALIRQAFALMDHKEEHQAYPEELTAIDSYVPSALPTDPFSGKAFIYKKKDEGFLLYSIGRNLKDDGGKRKIKQGNLEQDGDILWRMP